MKRSYKNNIILHVSENADHRALSDKVNQFHADIIQRRLKNSDLTTEEKIAVIDSIIAQLKSKEQNGIIK